MEKLKSAIHYICDEFSNENIGGVMLNKLLWFSDTSAFLKWGNPITEARYMKLKHGPVVKGLEDVIRTLEVEGKLRHSKLVQSQSSYPTAFGKTYSKHMYSVLLKFNQDDSPLSARELGLIRSVGEEYANKRAYDVSEISHGPAWDIVDIRDEIPVESIVLNNVSTEFSPEEQKVVDEQMASVIGKKVRS